MNIEKIKSKFHLDIPSLIGLIAQIAVFVLWLSPIIDVCRGLMLQSLTPAELLGNYDISVAGYINALFIFLAVAVWAGCAFKTSRRGKLIIPLVINYAQLLIIAAFKFVYIPNEGLKNVMSLNGCGIAMIICEVASIILCHVAYISIRKYRKSLKAAEQPEAQPVKTETAE